MYTWDALQVESRKYFSEPPLNCETLLGFTARYCNLLELPYTANLISPFIVPYYIYRASTAIPLFCDVGRLRNLFLRQKETAGQKHSVCTLQDWDKPQQATDWIRCTCRHTWRDSTQETIYPWYKAIDQGDIDSHCYIPLIAWLPLIYMYIPAYVHTTTW